MHRPITRKVFQTGFRLKPPNLRFSSSKVYNETAPFNPKIKRDATSWLSPYKILLGFMPIFTFGLGTWQIYRLQWKLDLIRELETQLEKDPMDLPRLINIGALNDFEWRRVTVHGEWDHEHSVLIGPRVKDGKQGSNVVTPLKRPSASTILVDRGFVENDLANLSAGPARTEGPVEVTGMLRLQAKKNSFTPDNDPAKGLWHWPDIEQLTEHAGGSSAGVQPVLVEEIYDKDIGERLVDLKKGVPVGRAPVVDIRNEHATYSVICNICDVLDVASETAKTALPFIAAVAHPARGRQRRSRAG